MDNKELEREIDEIVEEIEEATNEHGQSIPTHHPSEDNGNDDQKKESESDLRKDSAKTDAVDLDKQTKTVEERVKIIENGNKQKQKIIYIFAFIITILLIIGLVNGTWWAYIRLTGQYVPNVLPTPTPSPTPPTPTPQAEIDKTNWVELEISDASLSFIYPQGWKLQEMLGIIQDVYKLSPTSRTIGLNLSVWIASEYNQTTQSKFTNSEKVNINNIEMELANLTTPGNLRHAYRFNSRNNNYTVIAEIAGGSDNDYFYLLTEIVKTFRLGEQVEQVQETPQPNLPAIGWQRIESPGFRIDIPSSWSSRNANGRLEIINNVISDTVFWSVNSYDFTQTTKDEVISEIGAEYLPERDEERTNITDWNYPAQQIVITSEAEPLFYSQNIIVDSIDGTKFYIISSEGNREERFATFWKSFKLK